MVARTRQVGQRAAGGRSGRAVVPAGQVTSPAARILPKGFRRPTPHGLRVAAIDIGTNSLHMVIVEVTEQLAFRTLASEKDLTQLCSAALVRHQLTRRAMQHTVEVLGRYQKTAESLECDVVLAYATSAVRECRNGGDFLALAREQLGLHVHVISAQEEARLVYLAVRQAIDLSDGPVLIVDIGGGSAECIVGTAEKPLLLASRKLGASRLTQQFIRNDPVQAKELKALGKHIAATLEPIVQQAKALGVQRVIGTSGTMENLVAMCHMQHGEEAVRHRLLTEMTREDFAEVCKRLARLDLAQRRKLPGLDPGRADQIVAGAAVVQHVFDTLQVERIEVCDRAMREGMTIDYMQTHWPKVRLSVQVRDPRRRSVIELGRRCNFDEQHAEQVAKLAQQLFDAVGPRYGLDEESRELLEYAALLHDVGWHIGHSGHHKHSWYLIKNGDLEGFSPLEIDVIANVARYHRKSMPKKSHEAYMALKPPERKLVSDLASLLRIADGLDRGHEQNVEELKVVQRKQAVTIRLFTRDDPELEVWGAEHKADMFRAVFGMKVGFTARERG